MADKFNARDIPGRAHYDRLMTWATGVRGRLGHEELADIQRALTENAKRAAQSADDEGKVFAVLAELGFCAVIDNMADIIESKEPANG